MIIVMISTHSDGNVTTLQTMAERRKSSILTNRKLSTDFARKLSAISVASDVSLISERFGLEQGELRNIVQDILEMNINDDFDVSVPRMRGAVESTRAVNGPSQSLHNIPTYMFSLVCRRCFQYTVEFREVQLTALARSFTINFDFYQINIPKPHVPSMQHCSAAMAINTLH